MKPCCQWSALGVSSDWVTGEGTRKASGNVLPVDLGAVCKGEFNLRKFIKLNNDYFFTFLYIKKS